MRFYGMIDTTKFIEYTGETTEAALEKFTNEQLKTAEPRPKPTIDMGDREDKGESEENEDDDAPKKAAFEMTGQELEEHLNKEHHLVRFCKSTPECKNTEGIFKELHDLFAQVPDVHIVKIDCENDEDFCKKHNVEKYPTLIFFSHGTKGSVFSEKPHAEV